MVGQGRISGTLSGLPGLRPFLLALLAVVVMGAVMIGMSFYRALMAPIPRYFPVTVDVSAIVQLMITSLLIVAFVYGFYLALNTVVLWRRRLREDPVLDLILQRYASGELTKEQLDTMIRDVDDARKKSTRRLASASGEISSDLEGFLSGE